MNGTIIDTGQVATVDLRTTLERLSALATEVLGDHVSDADLCVVCGSAWPCERARLAAHNLAVL
jgi:hypothetical protein